MYYVDKFGVFRKSLMRRAKNLQTCTYLPQRKWIVDNLRICIQGFESGIDKLIDIQLVKFYGI